jgi:hypothetical protein
LDLQNARFSLLQSVFYHKMTKNIFRTLIYSMKIQSLNSFYSPNFKAATININAFSDTHGELLFANNAVEELRRRKKDVFEPQEKGKANADECFSHIGRVCPKRASDRYGIFVDGKYGQLQGYTRGDKGSVCFARGGEHWIGPRVSDCKCCGRKY